MQSAHSSVRCFSLDVAGLSPCTVNVISHQKNTLFKTCWHYVDSRRPKRLTSQKEKKDPNSKQDSSKIAIVTMAQEIEDIEEKSRLLPMQSNLRIQPRKPRERRRLFFCGSLFFVLYQNGCRGFCYHETVFKEKRVTEKTKNAREIGDRYQRKSTSPALDHMSIAYFIFLDDGCGGLSGADSRRGIED